MPDLPQPTDGSSISTAPSREALQGSTTDTGAPAPSDRNSLTVGPDGPILLHDAHFLNQMAHFNRERIPERNVHAKGSGAFGEFETTEDVSAYTKAALFQPGVDDRDARAVLHRRRRAGLPRHLARPARLRAEVLHDRGQLRPGRQQHPGLLHPRHDEVPALHPLARSAAAASGLRDNNMQWDFWSLNPESAHQVTYLMGDRGIPKTYRHMNGYGSHTYLWVNAAGEKHWVKYHFHSDQGVEGLTGERGDRRSPARTPTSTGATSTRPSTRGDFPCWTLSVQVMPYEDAKTYRFNPFDLTKMWPHSDYPLIKVGTMTLNRNPENFFAQIEQAAFEPSALVPGHRVLAPTRCCSAARSPTPTPTATGSARTTCSCRSTVRTSRSTPTRRTARWPTSTAATTRSTRRTRSAAGTPTRSARSRTGWETDGAMVRQAYTLREDDDDFGQAGTLVREVWDDEQRAAFVETVAGHLLGGVDGDVLERAFEYWKRVDAETAASRSRSSSAPVARTTTPAASPTPPWPTRPTPWSSRTRRPGPSVPGFTMVTW